MVNGQLTDSTRGRRPVIWFSTCCCASAEHLPASSIPASHTQPTDLRPALSGLLRYRRQDGHVFLYAFDLIELDGDDLRREPIERRKAALAKLLRHTKAGLLLNEHIDEPGDVVFRHACKLGLGIVSKRLGSPYHSGRSRHWVKSKNPQHPAVKREAEKDWAR